MSRFFSKKYQSLTPYTPGEQPQDQQYVKLNTNESPFPPSVKAIEAACREAQRLQLYSDPNCTVLTETMAEVYGIDPAEILFTNGSDEILDYAFKAFCDEEHPAAFPDISYGFYPVYAEANRIPYREIPLNEDLEIDPEDYLGIGNVIFLANPNAPTGIALPLSDIRRIVESNPDHVVVIDEAYVDFGAESAVSLIHEYDNLLVTQTFSKSRSMAGARLGVGFADASLIRDLNTLKYSTNPYNVNRMSMAAGTGVLKDQEYTLENCRIIQENRKYTMEKLRNMGFEMTDSTANFIFVKRSGTDGQMLYEELKKRGVLVRHFTKTRIRDYIRVTIGTREQMDLFLKTVSEILEG